MAQTAGELAWVCLQPETNIVAGNTTMAGKLPLDLGVVKRYDERKI
jgi:hypothetical protein